MMGPDEIGSIVAAIGALGTASFALVDATKVGRNGGVSNSGFVFIEEAVQPLFPKARRGSKSPGSADAVKLLDILHANWINGTALADQKAIAKSLIKLRLTESTAATFAGATSVSGKVLAEVAKAMVDGTAALTPEQSNVLGRFDLALTAMLDEGYQHADQRYRNCAKVLASVAAVLLAVAGGWAVAGTDAGSYFGSVLVWRAALCGLLAIPLAPISKDLTSALAAGVKVAQAIRK
jgi:hypothetical protein